MSFCLLVLLHSCSDRSDHSLYSRQSAGVPTDGLPAAPLPPADWKPTSARLFCVTFSVADDRKLGLFCVYYLPQLLPAGHTTLERMNL